MEVYTVIRYEFGFTKLIYTGTNKELAYKKLNVHKYHCMHTWIDDKEVRYEGDNVFQEYEYHNGKKRVAREIENYRKTNKKSSSESSMTYKEYDYPNGRKKLVKEIKNYVKEDQLQR